MENSGVSTLMLILFLSISSVLACGCSDDSSYTETNTKQLPADPYAEAYQNSMSEGNELSYSGVANVKIDYFEYDASGNRNYIGRNELSKNVQLFLSAPTEATGSIETNPFHLSIFIQEGSDLPTEGDLTINSATAVSITEWGGESLLLQYWVFTYNGGRIEGVLENTHREEGVAFNEIYALSEIYSGYITAWPFSIEAGATLQGTLDDNHAKFHIEGESVCRSREFAIDIDAKRIN